jgi:SAM-dependent methyltransferase
MKALEFERSGWARVDISPKAQARIAEQFADAGITVETLDVKDHAGRFAEWLRHHEYEGEYRRYAGELEHCLQEKALEHFLSVVIAEPREGMTAVDVGSCRSVVPRILRRAHGVRCLEQDLSYPEGVEGDRVGGSADAMPLEDGSVDFMTLHCTFEHFEGGADKGFMKECGRVLRPGGRTVILPLYLNATHCNVTGVPDPGQRSDIGWDPEADHYCQIPEWEDRFGRHYSVRALIDRVIEPARRAGLHPRVIRVVNWEAVDPRLWLRWVLVLERAGAVAAAGDARLREIACLRGDLAAMKERLAALEAAAEAGAHERNYLRAQVAELRGQFEFVEADRVARGKVIEEQGRRSVELTALVHATEQNRDWHQADAARLGAKLAEREAELGARDAELAAMRSSLAEHEARIAGIETSGWVRLGRRLKLL